MNTEFIPYEQALTLKELGFDKPCFGYWKSKNWLIQEKTRTDGYTHADQECPAPIYQQAFKWFREKYNLNYVIVKADSWFYTINGCNTQEGFKTYKEAENACLNKLIEIVKK